MKITIECKCGNKEEYRAITGENMLQDMENFVVYADYSQCIIIECMECGKRYDGF